MLAYQSAIEFVRDLLSYDNRSLDEQLYPNEGALAQAYTVLAVAYTATGRHAEAEAILSQIRACDLRGGDTWMVLCSWCATTLVDDPYGPAANELMGFLARQPSAYCDRVYGFLSVFSPVALRRWKSRLKRGLTDPDAKWTRTAAKRWTRLLGDPLYDLRRFATWRYQKPDALTLYQWFFDTLSEEFPDEKFKLLLEVSAFVPDVADMRRWYEGAAQAVLSADKLSEFCALVPQDLNHTQRAAQAYGFILLGDPRQALRVLGAGGSADDELEVYLAYVHAQIATLEVGQLPASKEMRRTKRQRIEDAVNILWEDSRVEREQAARLMIRAQRAIHQRYGLGSSRINLSAIPSKVRKSAHAAPAKVSSAKLMQAEYQSQASASPVIELTRVPHRDVPWRSRPETRSESHNLHERFRALDPPTQLQLLVQLFDEQHFVPDWGVVQLVEMSLSIGRIEAATVVMKMRGSQLFPVDYRRLWQAVQEAEAIRAAGPRQIRSSPVLADIYARYPVDRLAAREFIKG